ncbi:MAG TPA: hypothetical protein VMU17_05215 [Elusimicrobiota bacterium]|nr:hypothetical protein [Elusimicrobiota bacterium]
MRDRSGVTLIELVIFSSMAGVMMLAIAYFLNKPGQIQRIVATSDAEQAASAALDRLMNEFRAADPASFPWDVPASSGPLVIAKSNFDMATHSYQGVTKVAYYFQPESESSGSLMRLEQSSGTPKAILTPIDAPTDAEPLFQFDPDLHVVMISVRYHPFGMKPKRIVRRLSIEN